MTVVRRPKEPQRSECYYVLVRVIGLLGSQRGVGEVCGVSQQCVSGWLQVEDGRIPFEHLAALSAYTGMSPAELRPDHADILLNYPVEDPQIRSL